MALNLIPWHPTSIPFFSVPGLLFNTEDGNTRFLKTFGNDLPDFMGPYPGKQ
jgi:hypothetical protein